MRSKYDNTIRFSLLHRSSSSLLRHRRLVFHPGQLESVRAARTPGHPTLFVTFGRNILVDQKKKRPRDAEAAWALLLREKIGPVILSEIQLLLVEKCISSFQVRMVCLPEETEALSETLSGCEGVSALPIAVVRLCNNYKLTHKFNFSIALRRSKRRAIERLRLRRHLPPLGRGSLASGGPVRRRGVHLGREK